MGIGTMRAALFIDGKNFYAGWKDRAGGRRIDFGEMARWVVGRANGQTLWGAYYYTGVETGPASATEGQMKLIGFLDMLEMQPGYFVERFPRKANTFSCAACGAENRYTQEKEVDTTMVADMMRFAAVDAFDVLVLMSGDADYAPAIEGVRAIGKQAFVATWGGAGLSSRIRRAAFDHINPSSTMRGAESGLESSRFRDEPSLHFSEAERETFIEEVRRAEEKFQGGYVGANYFVTRWSSEVLEGSPESRRRLLDALVDDGRVEVYDAPDGKKAIRLREPTDSTTELRAPESEPEPDSEGRNSAEKA